MRTLLILLILAFCISCKKTPPPPTDTTGDLLFWTNDASDFLCGGGVLTVTLNNGKQSNITDFYNVSPASCVNLAGGFFNLDAGTYTYQIAGAPCNSLYGTVTVVAGTCNFCRFP